MMQIKIAIAAAVFLVGSLLGGAAAWKIQAVRIDGLKVETQRLTQENEACAKANTGNKATIEKLKGEIARAGKLCGARLKAKDALAARLQQIDAIKTPEARDETATTQDDGNSPAADPLFIELNGMWGDNKADRQN